MYLVYVFYFSQRPAFFAPFSTARHDAVAPFHSFNQGKGTTFVVYNDARLRVFRSDTGGVVVQTKAEEVVAA